MKQMSPIKKYALDLSRRSGELTGKDYDLWHSLKRCAVSIGMNGDELSETDCAAGTMFDAIGHAREMRLLTWLLRSREEQIKSRRVLMHFLMYEYNAKKKRKFDAQKRRRNN